MSYEFSFDQSGNLFPQRSIDIDWATLFDHFVNYFPTSSSRKQLLSNLERFIVNIQTNIVSDFKLWINGSFVSQKIDPQDIDAVFWLPFDVAERKKSILDDQFFTRMTKKLLGLDLYYMIEYPEKHKRHFLTHLDKLYWEDVYGHTRQDEQGMQHSKGFFELKIDALWKN